ncbi:MAG: hypothetical protein AAGH68_13180 [Pseudomonadota bacterium]
MAHLKPWLAICLALMAPWAHAASFDDPEWPCVQRKVLHLSTGQMWAGPLIEEADLTAWRKAEDVATLAPVLAVRRTAQEEADRLITTFADASGDGRAEKLRLLFAGTFALIDRERTEIIQGIARYAKTQTALSQTIEDAQNEITALAGKADKTFDDEDRIEELEDKLHWDMRIYKDRQQSLTFVCETPTILEKRAFSMARSIMNALE